MTPILMKHPLHGAMHAYDTAEKLRLEGYGWKEDKPVEAVVVEPKKRGPKPKVSA
jgi:hypothetical protein